MAEAIATAAAGWAVSVAGWVASPIVSRLLNEGFSYLGDTSIKDRLENLETTILPQFQLVIEAAEKSNEEHKTKLKLWLRKLKEAMYETEETLDLYKYQLLEKEVNDLNSASTSKSIQKSVGNLKKGLSSTLSSQKSVGNLKKGLSSTLSSQNKNKLRDSLIKLEKIAAEAQSFYQLFFEVTSGSSMTNNTTIGGPRKNTTSLVLSKVFGRDGDRDKIIDEYLLDRSEACESEASPVQRRSYSIVVVVGIGGAGKTTLAQHVYNDQRVVDNFGIKMWVCISRKLDVVKLTKEMIESASKKKCDDYENLDALQWKLIDLIKSKKVLLVLDDIWCYKSENEAEWEQLLAPLAFVEEGSKILVTTRPENRGNMPIVLHPKNIMKLKDLGENELILLFLHYAFRGTKLSDTHLQEELVEIGKQILRKLHKSPLAAKTVGCQLSKKLETNFWKATLEQDNLTDTQKALIWSYQRLDAPLQRCFSYFSLFPKGHQFIAEELVLLWMAEGFISTSNATRRMEDIGNDYWDELVSSSFLQFESSYGTIKYYNMHDLFHDLAERVSEEDCFRIEDDQVKKIPRSIRHLGISSETIGKVSMSFHKLKNLRTLFVNRELSNNDTNLLVAAIEKFEKLRVLKLSFSTIKLLPKDIGDLKHLRYLDISQIGAAELPLSLGKLHHLQLLDLSFSRIISLPRSLKNLFNLRYLKGTTQALATLPDIGKLTSLQRLKEAFEVKKEKGYDIGQLKNLNELRGSLTISHLENVEGKDQAIEASLKDKKHLDSLRLEWTSHWLGGYSNLDMEVGSNTHLDMEVVEGLRPPLNLTELKIFGCQSLGCPSWLIREGCLENLRSLCLENTSFEDLPTISKLFPHCQKLQLWNLPNLRTLPFLPQSLEELAIVDCPLLVFVSEEELQNSAERKKSIMTIVQSSQFNVSGDDLAEEYSHVRKLMDSEKIDIPEDFQTFATNLQSEEMITQVDDLNLREAYRCCQEQRLAAIFARKNKSQLFLPSVLQHLEIGSTNITDGALSLCLGGLTSLKFLKLDGIKTITIVPTNHLVSLCDLTIHHCHCLKSLGALHALLSLKELRISSCPCLELEMMESDGRIILPHSLQSLNVCNSTNTKRFAIGDLPDLIDIHLWNLPLLESLSLSGLTTLKELLIWDCPELSGLDCAKVSLNSSFGNLRIQNCPKLAEASFHFSSFSDLEIDSDATLGVLLSGSSRCLAALRSLYLSSCTEASFHEEHFNCLTSLERLRFHDCKVQSLPRSLKNLSSLEMLDLSYCPHISSLSSNLPESLKTLELQTCEGISSLPMRLPESLKILSLCECKGISSLSDLPNSLRELTLEDCPGISSLTMRLPESLERIRISRCPVLKKRCREAKGEDWPKIAHIPFRDIK